MNLTLRNNEFRPDGIFGTLSDENGKLIALTLQHAYAEYDDTPVFWVPKLPPGEYICRRGLHRLAHMDHDFETFEITNVPPFQGKPVTGILFHALNFNDESEGCVGVGEYLQINPKGVQWIKNSREAFQSLLELQEGINIFTLTVTDPSPILIKKES